MNAFSRPFPLPMLAMGALVLAGCLFDSSDTEHENHEDPWIHACEHVSQTPVAVTAGVTDSTRGELGDAHHEFFEITVSDSGAVAFSPEEHGDHAFLLNVDVPFAVFTAAGTSIEIEETVTGLEGCADLAVMHVAHLEDDETYHLAFGPTTEATVGLIIEEYAHEEEHEHE